MASAVQLSNYSTFIFIRIKLGAVIGKTNSATYTMLRQSVQSILPPFLKASNRLFRATNMKFDIFLLRFQRPLFVATPSRYPWLRWKVGLRVSSWTVRLSSCPPLLTLSSPAWVSTGWSIQPCSKHPGQSPLICTTQTG